MKQSVLVAVLGMLATACSSVCCPPSNHCVGGRQFVVVHATPLGPNAEGRRQVLIEASVWSVRSGSPIEVIDQADRLDVTEAPVWLAHTPGPDVTFGAGSLVEQRPSIVTQEEDEARIQVAEVSGDSAARNMSEIRVTPTFDAESALTLEFRFDQYNHGRRTHTVPTTRLSGPAGRAFIIESLPAR